MRTAALVLNLEEHEPPCPPTQGTPPRASLQMFFSGIFVLLCLTSCQTVRHQFVGPASDWQAKVGQLQYHGRKTTLIGEVLVRYSTQGDFELTFTKGPGVTLLMLRQDETFAHVEGPLARGRWSGPVERAPRRLQGWLALRTLLMKMTNEQTLKHRSGDETFVFRF
jgi:hypothetical protein